MFKTGSMCPISAKYSFVKHTDQSPCMSRHEEIISLERDSIFPPSRTCGNSVYWVLCREDNESN